MTDKRRRRANGEGGLRKRTDGRWVGTLDLGWVDGGRKRKYVYGRTQAEAKVKLNQVRRAHEAGMPLPDSRLTVAKFLSWWIEEHVPGRVRPRTLFSYEQKIRHITRLLGHIPLAQLRATQVEVAFNQLLLEGHSPGGVRAVRAVFRTAMKEADKKSLVVKNVVALADGPKVEERDRDPFTQEEIRRIREAMEGDRLKSLFFVGLAKGLREGEAFGLRWSDVDLDEAWLDIRQQVQRVRGGFEFVEPKTKASKNRIELSPNQVEMLLEHRRRLAKERLLAGGAWQDYGLVFPSPIGTPLDPSNVRNRFRLICAAANVRPRRIHDWRVTAASWLGDLNIHPETAKQILRHSQQSTTMKHYTRTSSATRRGAIVALDEMFNG